MPSWRPKCKGRRQWNKNNISTCNPLEIEDACKEAEINTQTNCRWRKQYGGLEKVQAKRMKELEKEKGRQRRISSQDVIETLSEVMLWRGLPDP